MNKTLITLLLLTVIAVPVAAQTQDDKEDAAKRAVRQEAIDNLMQSHRECLLTRMDWQSQPCMIFKEKLYKIPLDHLVPNLPPTVKLTREQEIDLRWGAYSNLSTAWIQGRISGIDDTYRNQARIKLEEEKERAAKKRRK